MSCSVHGMEPVSYRGMLYADGGFTDALPLAAFGPGSVIGVRLVTGDERTGDPPNVARVSPDPRDPKGLMRRGYEAARALLSC